MVLVTTLCLGGYATRQTWLRMGAEMLLCNRDDTASDVILVDNISDSYLLFERSRQLQVRGLASAVLIPIIESERSGESSAVSLGFADVMCRIARVTNCITFPAASIEPISLNLARRVAHELQARGVRSVLLVTDGFRSKRAFAVYSEALKPLDIAVHCQPVLGSRTPTNWYHSSHGFEEVVLQLAKLLYYRLFVLQ